MRRSVLLAILALSSPLASFTACSSTEDPAPATPGDDAGADVVVDAPATETTPDTATPETGPLVCAQDLPSSFACAEPRKAVAKTTCTEALLQEFAAKCVVDASSVPAECTAWKSANAACAACVEDWSWDEAKILTDDYQCYEMLVPGCGKAMNCDLECPFEVCGECDDTAGTGSGGGSELDDCVREATAEGGRCYEVSSKKAKECFDDPKGAPCAITQYYTSSGDLAKLREEIVRVLRGACRDGGDWSKAGEAGDAGPADTGSDAAGDASDAASDAAGDASDASDAAAD